MNTTRGCMSSMPLGYKSILQGPYIAAELLIALTAVIGNLLVCLAVSCNRKLRTVTNYFLVSLSVADILVGLVAIPCAVLTDLGRPHHDLPLCLVLLSILMVLTQSSTLSMLAVAVERYVAILRPFHYQRVMSPRNARVALLLTWSLALLSGSVPLMDWQSQSRDAGYCIFTCVVDMTYMVYFNFFGCLLLPLLFMFIIYAHIFYTMHHQLRRIAVARGGAPSEASPTPLPAVVSVTGGGGTRDPETLHEGTEQGAPTRGALVGAADSGVGGAVRGSGQRITQRSAGGEEGGFSSRGAAQIRLGEGKRVTVGVVEGPDRAVEEEEEEEEQGHARVKVTGLAEAGGRRAWSGPVGRASRGGVGKTTPRSGALCEAGGDPGEPAGTGALCEAGGDPGEPAGTGALCEAGGDPGEPAGTGALCEAGGDPGEPAGTGAAKQRASGVRTQTLRPVIQTKTTTVFRKMSRRSTRTSCSGSDDRPPESNKPGAARARLEIQKATSLFLVLLMFMVCLIPIHLINCILLLRPQCQVPMSITLVAILLSHANSALNPLLYAYRMRSFRHTLRGMCSWRSTPKPH